MTTGGFSGHFVDSEDKEAMERWAKGLCQGLDVQQAAKELEVEPTAEAIALRIVGRATDDPEIRISIIEICERELRASGGD